jgi:uncharacterized protein
VSTTQQAVRPTDPTGGRPVVPSTGVLRPLGLSEIALTGGFWSCRQRTNAQATLAHCQMWMERLGWVANFDRVADATTRPDRPGLVFSDSEIYKLLEAMAWEFGRTGDLRVDAAFRALSERVVRAQDADGYLNTSFGHGGQAPRYCDLAGGHELYCAGHLLQAAVARLRTYGVDELVEAARRSADHVCDTFGAGGIASVCGHPEIELGLVELGRALGEQRYVDQALLFVDRRGHGTLGDHAFGREYYQDDVPVRDADAWRGHAVRALYLSAAAVDVAVERKDQVLLEAIARQWANTVARRTYLTGGMGSHHQDEGFGRDWVLPADRAYCETCAGVGSVMVSWRLFLATGDVRYADLIERTFFNIVATSVREDGRAFFYANTLHQRVPGPAVTDDEVSPRASSSMRAPWFDVSCCPTNLARTMATWHTYAAAIDRTGLSICQYAAATVRTTLQDGREIGLDIQTNYPRSGLVTVHITRPTPGPWTLRLRIPEWAEGAVVQDGGQRTLAHPGFFQLERAFAVGDQITLDLPMAPRFTNPSPHVDAVRGCVAVERGPEVLCLESVDLPAGVSLDEIRIDTSIPPSEHHGRVLVAGRRVEVREDAWPYSSGDEWSADSQQVVDLPLTPYHAWADRGPSRMRVWLPTV